MKEIEVLIGQRICKIRKTLNLTQTRLAEKAKISRDFLSRVERGQTGISIHHLSSIAHAIGVPITHLVDPEKTIWDVESFEIVKKLAQKMGQNQSNKTLD